jgi:hypothetical protein
MPPIVLAAFADEVGAATCGTTAARGATLATTAAEEILLIGGEVAGWTDGLRIAGAKLGIVVIGEALWAGPRLCRPSGVAPTLL